MQSVHFIRCLGWINQRKWKGWTLLDTLVADEVFQIADVVVEPDAFFTDPLLRLFEPLRIHDFQVEQGVELGVQFFVQLQEFQFLFGVIGIHGVHCSHGPFLLFLDLVQFAPELLPAGEFAADEHAGQEHRGDDEDEFQVYLPLK